MGDQNIQSKFRAITILLALAVVFAQLETMVSAESVAQMNAEDEQMRHAACHAAVLLYDRAIAMDNVAANAGGSALSAFNSNRDSGLAVAQLGYRPHDAYYWGMHASAQDHYEAASEFMKAGLLAMSCSSAGTTRLSRAADLYFAVGDFAEAVGDYCTSYGQDISHAHNGAPDDSDAALSQWKAALTRLLPLARGSAFLPSYANTSQNIYNRTGTHCVPK